MDLVRGHALCIYLQCFYMSSSSSMRVSSKISPVSGSKLTPDSKYYLKHDTGTGKDENGYNAKGSDRANMDVLSGDGNTKIQLQVECIR